MTFGRVADKAARSVGEKYGLRNNSNRQLALDGRSRFRVSREQGFCR
jgi:hypothetical protein